MVESKLYKVRDLEERYGVTARAVYRWISDSKLDAIKISGRIRIPEESLSHFEKNARDRNAG
jgi:predicted site-specific integrase-resolvase